MNIMPLAPKMTIQYAEMARRGEADREIGGGWYEFYRGNQVISVLGPDNPIGSVKKVTTKEMEQLRKEAERERAK